MKRYVVWCGVVLLAVAPLALERTAPPASKVILDLWDAAYLDGAKMGLSAPHRRTDRARWSKDFPHHQAHAPDLEAPTTASSTSACP